MRLVLICNDIDAYLLRPYVMPDASGVAYYNTFLRSVSLKKVFFWSAMVLIAVHIAQVVLVTGEAPVLMLL